MHKLGKSVLNTKLDMGSIQENNVHYDHEKPILDVLNKYDKITIAVIQKLTSIPRSSIQVTLLRLERDGRVESERIGKHKKSTLVYSIKK